MAQLALVLLTLLLQAPAALLLEGQVVTLGDNTPVPRARIVVARVGGAVEDYRTGIADANGRFTFSDLTAGSYRVFAERQGFLRGEHGRRVSSGNGTPVWMVEGQPTRITIPMIATGAIAGRVLENGRPLRNVIVRAMRASFLDGRRSLSIADYARSDDLGEYRLFGLGPGIYYVSTLPFDRPRIEGDTYVVPTVPSNANRNQSQIWTPAVDALAGGLIDASAFENGIFVPLFFPGTTDESRAAAIDVQPGRTATGIDLTVARVPTARIRGRVIDGTTGRPAQNVSVGVTQQEGRTLNIASSRGNASGEFELPAVPAGRYELSARTTTDPRLFGTVAVEVRDRDVEAVVVTIRPGNTLKGHITVVGAQSSTALPPISVQLDGVDGFGYSALRIAPDGTFTIDNVEAREYRVRFTARGRRTPESVTFGGVDVTSGTFRFGPDVADNVLELVLNLAGGAIDVAAVDASQRGVTGVTVALVPDARRRNQSALYRTASTDEFGRIRFDDVTPGEYLLFTDDVEPSAWQDPEVIRRYENRGTRVLVVANARQNVTLRVTR